jgi:hypothetical protein
MVAALLGALLAPAVPQESVNQLVSRMLKVYDATRMLDGQVVLTAMDGSGTTKMVTDIAYSAPSKLLVRQVAQGSNPVTTLIVSNGEKFVYSPPEYLPSRGLLAEPVNDGGYIRQYREIYAVGAVGLADRSPALDILIARPDDLKALVGKFLTVDDLGSNTINGKQVRLVGGSYRDGSSNPAKYRMAIDANGHLVQFVTQHTVYESGRAHSLSLVYDVNVTLGVAPADARFRLP